MGGQVEARRSGRKLECSTPRATSLGTRSSTIRVEGTSSVSTRRVLALEGTDMNARKRSRGEVLSTSDQSLESTCSGHIEVKKVKLADTEEDTSKTSSDTKHCRTQLPTSRTDPATKSNKKKVSPLTERMEVLRARYTRVALALLASEAAHVEFEMAEIKKGLSRELSTITQPLDEARQERLAIADKRLALQKAQADKEWNAARTCAQYDFVKQRGDLRTSMRQTMSRKVFDVSREYRHLSTEVLGVVPNHHLEELGRNLPVLMHSPQGASLTEKDEDLLLMDIQSKTAGPPEADARILAAAPILDGLTAPAKCIAQKRLVPSKRASRPKSRVLSQATSVQPEFTARSTADQALVQERNHDPTSSLPATDYMTKKEKVPRSMTRDVIDTQSHLNAQSNRSGRATMKKKKSDVSKHGQRPQIEVPQLPPPSPQGHARTLSQPHPMLAPKPPSLFPVRAVDGVSSGNIAQSREGLQSSDVSSTVNHEYNPWPPQQKQPVSYLPTIDKSSRLPPLPMHKREFDNVFKRPAMSSNSAFNATIGSHAHYVSPSHVSDASEAQRPSEAATISQSGQHNSLPFPQHIRPRPNSSTSPSRGSSLFASPLHPLSGHGPGSGSPGLLHPFRRSEPLHESGIDQAMQQTPAGHSLPFPGHASPRDVSGQSFNASTPPSGQPESGGKQGGILWGGLRR